MVNRKLIRTTLAEVKEREQQLQHQAQQARQAAVQHEHRRDTRDRDTRDRDRDRDSRDRDSRDRDAPHSPPIVPSGQQLKKKIPPEQTNAETFYYKKQMDAKTPMVIVLQDGEDLRGTIEWYDKGSIKLHRLEGPNLLVLKHNIKYLYKDQPGSEGD